MLEGKTSKSYRKKDFNNQKSLALGFKNLVFAHQCVGGETFIDLSSLVKPSGSEWATLVNPSLPDIVGARLFFYKNNITILRSAAGSILPYGEFHVVSGTRINISTPALANEIFYGQIITAPQTGIMGIDGRKIMATGTLTAGQVDINVGAEFKVNENSNQRVGEVVVLLDGAIQYRNIDNANDTSKDYREVGVAGGYATVIEMNASAGADREYVVFSQAYIVQRPDGSRDSAIETNAGILDAMVPYLAAACGVDESTFQVAPNNVQLKQFGDRVLSNLIRIGAIEPYAQKNMLPIEQYILTVAGAGWTTTRAVGVPYQTLDGTWRLKFNVSGSHTIAGSGVKCSIAGILFNFTQSVSVYANTGTVQLAAFTSTSTSGGLYLANGAGVFASLYFSGDVELGGKPNQTYFPGLY